MTMHGSCAGNGYPTHRQRRVQGGEKVRIPCIPAFEEGTIAKVVKGCQDDVDKVIYGDSSNDLTTEIHERLGAEVIRPERNLGKGEALKTLSMRPRDMDDVVRIDGDDQHNP